LNDRGRSGRGGGAFAWRRLSACIAGPPGSELRRQQARDVDLEKCRPQAARLLQRRSVAAQDLLFMRDKEFPVVGGAAQELGILEELSEAEVAVIAEEAAHHAGVMGVIDARRPGEFLPADEAQAVLAHDHPVEILL
jgi:hypothetical protein